MSPIFDAYGSVPALRSALFQNPSALTASSIPPTETLASLQQELEDLKRRAGERAEKAERDIKILANVWRQAKAHEKEKNRDRDHGPVDRHHKGKAKPSGGNIKREQSETPVPDDSILVTNGTRAPHHSRKTTSFEDPTLKREKDRDNKKKRKRDEKSERDRLEDGKGSDLLGPTPAPSHTERPSKKMKSSLHIAPPAAPLPQSPQPPINPEIATDFFLPNITPPTTRPVLGFWGTHGILHSTPGKITDVTEDYTNVKAPSNQSQIGPFWKEVDTWMRPVGEEDVAWLRYATDDTDIFRVPKLGRHYTEVWEQEDQLAAAQHQSLMNLNGDHAPLPHPVSNLSNSYASTSGAGPSSGAVGSLTDSDLVMQKKNLGPLTERVLSAMLETQDATPGSKKEQDEGPLIARPSTSQATFSDMEIRMKEELRACGLLGADDPVFNESQDDDIVAEIRTLQNELRKVKRVNDARKERLSNIAKDRLAYQEYFEMLDNLNRQIATGHQRIVKANKGVGKKKKGPGQQEPIDPVKAAKSMILDVPEGLVEKIELRRKFKDVFGSAMQDWEARSPGRIITVPEKSVYSDIPALEKGNIDNSPTDVRR